MEALAEKTGPRREGIPRELPAPVRPPGEPRLTVAVAAEALPKLPELAMSPASPPEPLHQPPGQPESLPDRD